MIVIGEKINGTLSAVREAIIARDEESLRTLARIQDVAGADYIDVNVAVGTGEDEARTLGWAIGIVKEATDKPIALDSADPAVLSRGLELCGEDRPFINSVNGDEERLSGVLPLVAKYGCPVVALAMDESGIPATPEARLNVCERIMARAVPLGIPAGDLFFDPLVLPISADCDQGRVTLDTLDLIKSRMPEARTVMGLSNVSYGLPRRPVVNRAMLAIAAYHGLDAAVIDPTDGELIAAAMAAEAIASSDRYCRNFMKAFRAGLF